MTQAPLENTIADFWNMIYIKKLGTIVMLNNLQEGNKVSVGVDMLARS
jgi:protein tyrosine phosphatase